MNPEVIKKVNLPQQKCINNWESLPEIANKSIVNEEADPQVLNEDAGPRPSTLTGSVAPVISIPKPGNMIITVGKRKFECMPIKRSQRRKNLMKYSK